MGKVTYSMYAVHYQCCNRNRNKRLPKHLLTVMQKLLIPLNLPQIVTNLSLNPQILIVN